MKHFKVQKTTIVDLMILFSIIGFLFTYFKPSLLFSDTLISAGDTVGHFYGTYYMNQYLIPHLKLIGWSRDWFLGYPAFQFYFPLVFFITGLLGYLIPLSISFKIGTVLGTFLLPLCAYLSFRFMKFKFPVPIIASSMTLIFLFLERVSQNQVYSMWGGNIPSTLAGEFSYSFSLSIAILFFGLLYKGIKEDRYIILNAIVFNLILLSHIIVALFVLIGALFYLITKDNFKNNLRYLFKFYLLAFLLSGFWSVPLMMKMGYTVPHVWEAPSQTKELMEQIIPQPLIMIYILAIIVGIISIKKREKRPLFFLYLATFSLVLFLLSPTFNSLGIHSLEHLQLVKFLPFLYLSLLMAVASGFFLIPKDNKIKCILSFLFFILSVYWVQSNSTFISGWIRWNYEGYESKKLYKDYQKANEFLSKYPEGRVAFEYDPQKYDSGLGSSRATETIPVFSGRSITEGTHFQSAFSGSYIYNAHCEYSNGCSCLFGAISGGCPSYDIKMGTKHLELFNVKHFFVSSDKVKKDLSKMEEWKRIYGPAEFEIWELTTHNGNYVGVPIYYPILVKTNKWRELSYQWFKDPNILDVPLVWTKLINSKDAKRFENKLIEPSKIDLTNIKKVKFKKNCNIQENIQTEEITFTTDCIGEPHLIKISYFPNWKVEGADRIYLTSPAYMLVYPNQKEVKLYYGNTFSDITGKILTACGILVIIVMVFYKRFRKIPFNKGK
ncbi:hypothetical protein DRN69_07735 [Candidatus Pacearchaeota archaeon]|nr:MAG: hypothetical protein DRN69_07735 [Candidatus Pacearchaeota archaeon]